MQSLPRCIAISCNCRVTQVAVPDQGKPNSFTLYKCDFQDTSGRLVSIPAYAYLLRGTPAKGDFAWCVGDFFFPPGKSEGWVQANEFKILFQVPLTKQVNLGASSVTAIGEVATVIKDMWYMDVGVYDRN
ncbi:hypothetical protein FRC08_000627, partial [Ceratobasidium sp. 394]